MMRVLHQCLLALITFAILGGTAARSSPSIAPVATTGVPCDMMMPMTGADHGTPAMPCKGMPTDCVKMMGCVADTYLPAVIASHSIVVRLSIIGYWIASSEMMGLPGEPEPLPPRTV